MFWNKQRIVEPAPPIVAPPPPLVVPVGHEVMEIPLEDNERLAYERTCNAIGFEPASLLHARLLSFFKAKGIRVFDYKEVVSYMDAKAKAQEKIWHWRPLREADVITSFTWGGNRGNFGAKNNYYCATLWECRPYHRPVPLRVLVTVEQIYKQFGDKVKFFVTDYTAPKPDPFIAAVASDMPRVIFDFWDEPNFAASIE